MSGDLFPTAPDAVALASPAFRIVRVCGDHMSPGLRHDRDFVLATPQDVYDGPGRYVLEFGGDMLIYDCEKRVGRSDVWLACANPHYSGQAITLDQFNDAVVAKVGADIKVRDEAVLRRAS